MPLVGAYIADESLGRFRTISYSLFISMLGHIILITSALPIVIEKKKIALAVFSVGLVFLGTGTGGFKSSKSYVQMKHLLFTNSRRYIAPDRRATQ